MNPNIVPVAPGATGPEVADLQAALGLLIEREAIKPAGGRRRPTAGELRTLTTKLNDERATATFGEATQALTRYFQIQNDLGDRLGGVVDQNTAVAINAAIGNNGDQAVEGRVTDENGEPLSGATVIAFGCALRDSTELGRSRTDALGGYRIDYRIGATPDHETNLKLQVLAADGRSLLQSDITFGAPKVVTIDLPIGGADRLRPSEFSALSTGLASRLGRIKPAELVENDTYQDLTFLAGETGAAKEHLALYAVAARMSTSTSLPAELFYALLRGNVVPNAETVALASTEAGVDLGANTERLQEALLAVSPTVREQAVSSAVAANLVPLSYAAEAEDDLAKLSVLSDTAALGSTRGFGKSSVRTVLDAVGVNADVQQKFINLYANATGTGRRSFWKKLADNPDFTPQQVGDLRFGMTVGRFTSGHVPLISELTRLRGAGTISSPRDIARWTKTQWQDVLRQTVNGAPIGVPANLATGTPDADIDAYATELERRFELAYPTPAFAARLAADTQSPVPAGPAVARFVDDHPNFSLQRTNIDAFAATVPMADDVRAGLLTAQRVAKLTPRYSAMRLLLADGIHSARQVYAVGANRFIATYGSQPDVGPTEAARMYQRAEQTYGMALALITRVNDAVGSAGPAAVGGTISKELQAQLASFPTLQTLFGPDTLCACEECRSVLGPAAYLVDLLEFVRHRAAGSGATVKDALLARRPDIAQIELSCENTNTALPYIDLVNELLEDAVAPPPDPTAAARARQTTLTTAELNANPQYVNAAAYDALATAVYPWTLPFNLPVIEARTYLAQLGIDRVRLASTFSKPLAYPSAQASALAAERLGFSATEADIVTGGPLTSGHQSWDYWGLAETGNVVVDPADPTATVSGSWIDVLTQTRVLLSRAKLSYQELVRLLNTRFVDDNGAVSVECHPADSCSVATMTMIGLTPDVLDRLHRFVRLWRRLGWNVYDVDDAIAVLQSTVAAGLPRLNDTLLRQLAVITAASNRCNVPARQVISMFGSIPTRSIPTMPGDEAQTSLYHDLFANLTVLNPVDPVFALDADESEIATIGSGPRLAEHAPALAAAFEISSSDLGLAATTFTDGALSLANLSTLYRHLLLARMLNVTISELVSLLALVEAPGDPAPFFERVQPFDGARPEALLVFVDVVDRIRQSGLSLEQLDYLLRDVENTGTGVAPDAVTVGTLLLGVRNGLIRIDAETAFAPDPTGAATQRELAKLMKPTDVSTVMAILNGQSQLSAAEQNAVVAASLGPYTDASTAQAKLVGGGALSPGQARFEYVLRAVLDHQRRTRSAGLVTQTLAQALGIETVTTALLLSEWLPSGANPPSGTALDDFLALSNTARTASKASEPIAPDETGFAGYFRTYAILAKTALLISAHRLSTDDVRWWHDVGVGQGWVDPTSLPSAPSATADGRFYRWERLAAAARVRDRIRTADRSFRALLGAAGGGTTKAACLTRLAAITGWAADALAVLCGDPGSLGDHGSLSLVYPDDYTSERALTRLLPCFVVMAQTGIPADISTWLEPTPTGAAVDAIKQSVKARYTSTEWLTIAKALRDPLRACQRDGLVAYLLAHPPTGVSRWLDPDDVFAHYLIDVQMAPCQATSRIVQATAAVQLFIQRCFLNLEPAVSVDVTADSDWLQWQWLDRFRLWQANREIFLFPENWIDPALRRDKSPFFAELEQELLQGDLTNDAAEAALGNYLSKLRSVARPDVCGMYHDLADGKDELHVIARTQGVPPAYYHRTRVDGSRWTPWQKVDLDINSEHILPVVWNHKLYLFWTIIDEKADQRQDLPPAQANTASNTTRMHYEIQLAWSRYSAPKWQAKQTVPQALMFPRDVDPSAITLKSSFRGDSLVIDVFRGYYISTHKGTFQLAGSGDGAEVFVVNPTLLLADMSENTREVGLLPAPLVKTELVPPSGARLDANTMSASPTAQRPATATRPRTYILSASYDLYGVLGSEVMLNQVDYFRLLVPHQTPRFDSTLPFFYLDSARQYFCVPAPYVGSGGYLTRNAPRYTYQPTYTVDYRMWPFYHPFAGLFVRELNRGGVDGLFTRGLQLDPAGVVSTPSFDFQNYYLPSANVLPLSNGSYPAEEVDFAYDAAYAYSNWELFFHAPFLIAASLSTNQRFEDAKRWYEFVFNPSSATTDPVPQRFWTTKPFFQMTEPDYADQQITALMNAVHDHDPVAEHQVAEWRKHPFDPHVIAALRPVAYQRAIVMKYIDNLIAWGDRLFRQNTMESINQATQLYVMARALLGPRPQIVEPSSEPTAQTYADLEGSLDDFANAVVAAENAIPPVRVNVLAEDDSPKLPSVYTLYFRIPPNVRLLRYWDTVEDRLFKIRHCMNIEGVVQQLPLFAPPIDPGLLVRAVAAGLDLGSVLSDLDAALPPYRFATMIRLALDLCTEVRSFGSELGQALEKRDAEALSVLRSGRERQLQSKIADVRSRQIDEVDQQIDAIGKTRQVLVDRSEYYKNRDLMNGWEAAALVSQGASLVNEALAAVLQGTSAVAHTIGIATTGGAGFGGSPVAMFSQGGMNAANAASSSATISRIAAAVLQTTAQMTSTLGGYHQRQDQWSLEATLAEDEIARVDSEALGAAIRRDVAVREQAAQGQAVSEAADTDDFLHTKFTNRDLFDWMVAQASTTHFQAYQLAYTVAKQAEQCYRRELAVPDSTYVQFGYWDSLRKGLTAGDKLEYDLHRLEAAYHTQNVRELEITKHVSLLTLDPFALVQLRSTGSCVMTVPELFFDLDNPGHYLRRLKNVSVTVPCVVGPYATISLSLTLLDNHLRVSTDTSAGYPRTAGTDGRFIDDPGGGSTVVTSTAQNDSGLFEMRLDDPRFLPFEGAGAASTWRVALNAVYPGFDYRTIADVVLHLRYTARDGGRTFATAVTDAVKSRLNELALAQNRRGLYRLFSARHEYSTGWARFLNADTGQDQTLTIEMPPERFPFFTNGLDIKVGGLDVLAKTRDSEDYTVEVTPPGGGPVTATMSADAALGGVHHWVSPPFTPKIELGRAPMVGTPPVWQVKLKKASANDFRSLAADEVEDIVLIIGYQVS